MAQVCAISAQESIQIALSVKEYQPNALSVLADSSYGAQLQTTLLTRNAQTVQTSTDTHLPQLLTEQVSLNILLF
jgi:hypothetical protein